MILAGLALLAVGGADLVRSFLPLRPLGYAIVGVIVLALGGFSGGIVEAVLAVGVAALWLWLMPADADRRDARASFWPAALLAAFCAVSVAVLPSRETPGLIGQVWHLPSPVGELGFDDAVLVAGVVLFLFESANVVVRVSLAAGRGDPPIPGASHAHGDGSGADGRRAHARSLPAEREADRPASPPAAHGDRPASAAEPVPRDTHETNRPAAPAGPPATPAPTGPQPSPTGEVADAASGPAGPPPAPTLKGGRLIGPLERIIVFALTLAMAYQLLAAFIAAKGIVRFPEISRDRETGSRAEYFLVGSMVSWVQALAAALLVWWGIANLG